MSQDKGNKMNAILYDLTAKVYYLDIRVQNLNNTVITRMDHLLTILSKKGHNGTEEEASLEVQVEGPESEISSLQPTG